MTDMDSKLVLHPKVYQMNMWQPMVPRQNTKTWDDVVDLLAQEAPEVSVNLEGKDKFGVVIINNL
eukprot:CAMPEP_0201282180 /NCGR_PEP_ID=MMETSP1317-20130820/5015_1 /ASSEMBLY_ACC=CAM_ASM_000770 /TAXON_ID=187299 /ORGANISM="Undescribed Undescribed, Strain Undescribed" /LENGTH=64 /DNA_ID=CAMNT_0047594161 /DNA_START=123 /DNA_END=317 /DNA_ORIENTATION=-